MGAIASQFTSLTIVSSIVYSDADQRKHQSSASLAFVREFTEDWWFPCTNGQLRGKCFHLMTSSCVVAASALCHVVKSMQLIWRSDSLEFHLWVHGLQIHCGIKHRDSSLSNECQVDILYYSYVFGRHWHFWMHLFEWKIMCFDSRFTEVCFCWQLFGIGSGNCLVPNRRQAITLNNDIHILWCHMASSDHNELVHLCIHYRTRIVALCMFKDSEDTDGTCHSL